MSTSRADITQNIFVMSLGEIVSPNMLNGVNALAELTKSSSKTVLEVIGKRQSEINQFKLGSLNEVDFDNILVAAISAATGVTITTEQFNEAWAKMNPAFEVFEDNLNAAIQYNAQLNHKFIFVSFTNPKDIRQLIATLNDNSVPHQIAEDQDGKTHLKSIDGIELLLTYVEKKTKDELVKQVRERFDNSLTLGSSFDLKYVQGKDKLAPNIMPTVEWDKASYKTLQDLIGNNTIALDKVITI